MHSFQLNQEIITVILSSARVFGARLAVHIVWIPAIAAAAVGVLQALPPAFLGAFLGTEPIVASLALLAAAVVTVHFAAPHSATDGEAVIAEDCATAVALGARAFLHLHLE